MSEIIIAVLGGSALAALINQIGEYVRQRRKHKDATDDKEDSDMKALKEGMKYVLYDRIRWLGQAYIAKGEVDFDDRRVLHSMHNVYHNLLGGNGDLDSLMQEVNELPLKV